MFISKQPRPQRTILVHIVKKLAAVTCCSSSRLRRDIRNIPFMKIRLQRKIVGGVTSNTTALVFDSSKNPQHNPLEARLSLQRTHLSQSLIHERVHHSQTSLAHKPYRPHSSFCRAPRSSKSLLNSATFIMIMDRFLPFKKMIPAQFCNF